MSLCFCLAPESPFFFLYCLKKMKVVLPTWFYSIHKSEVVSPKFCVHAFCYGINTFKTIVSLFIFIPIFHFSFPIFHPALKKWFVSLTKLFAKNGTPKLFYYSKKKNSWVAGTKRLVDTAIIFVAVTKLYLLTQILLL